MADNIAIRMTYEHARVLSTAIDEALIVVRKHVGELGYEDNVIEFEIGLQLARRANRFLDLSSAADPQPVNGHSKGVNKP